MQYPNGTVKFPLAGELDFTGSFFLNLAGYFYDLHKMESEPINLPYFLNNIDFTDDWHARLNPLTDTMKVKMKMVNLPYLLNNEDFKDNHCD